MYPPIVRSVAIIDHPQCKVSADLGARANAWLLSRLVLGWVMPAASPWLAVQDTICMDLSLIQVPSLGAGSQATSVRSLHLTFQTGKYCHQVDDDSINDERRY